MKLNDKNCVFLRKILKKIAYVELRIEYKVSMIRNTQKKVLSDTWF